MKTHIEYPYILFWKYNIPYPIEMGTYALIDLLWAGGSLHPPNRLASDKTEEFLPKHVPHVYKDHIGKIHLALIPVGRWTGPESPEYLPRAV